MDTPPDRILDYATPPRRKAETLAPTEEFRQFVIAGLIFIGAFAFLVLGVILMVAVNMMMPQ